MERDERKKKGVGVCRDLQSRNRGTGRPTTREVNYPTGLKWRTEWGSG